VKSVRNLCAAGCQAWLRCGQRTEKITAVELPAEQAAPISRVSLQAGPPGIRRLVVGVYRRPFELPYLDIDMNSAREEIRTRSFEPPSLSCAAQGVVQVNLRRFT
jgi:hypothetical protein